ncbi:MAG TPA: class I SAM-dependent methyltransferase [Anaerolineales bacterium]|nr:class I SAM-dependent methyltransferase [Anaerolineales bacterium]
MAEHLNLYRRALYYDIALQRDVSREVGFLTAAYRHYTAGELGSVLELACGPGYHARAFAARGVRAAGLDLSREMLDLAGEKANAEGLDITWIKADMRSFRLENPVDMVICMFDGIDALLTNQDLIQNFRTVADNLNPGGLYLIDLTHPRECDYNHYGDFRYSGERDGVKVEILWATNNPQFDLVSAVARTDIEIRVNYHGKESLITDSAVERLLLPQEIILLAQLSEALQVVGWHGDYDLAQPLDHTPGSQRMICILQKPG